jgi:hypothetical protein
MDEQMHVERGRFGKRPGQNWGVEVIGGDSIARTRCQREELETDRIDAGAARSERGDSGTVGAQSGRRILQACCRSENTLLRQRVDEVRRRERA